RVKKRTGRWVASFVAVRLPSGPRAPELLAAAGSADTWDGRPTVDLEITAMDPPEEHPRANGDPVIRPQRPRRPRRARRTRRARRMGAGSSVRLRRDPEPGRAPCQA